MNFKELTTWVKLREQKLDKTTMLLEHFLLIHFDYDENGVVATRKEISEFNDWTFKTTSKAISHLQETGLWSIEETGRTVSFKPDIILGVFDSNEDEVTKLVWENSATGGTSLEVSLALAYLWNIRGEQGYMPYREISTLTGRAVSTVVAAIDEILEFGEWNKIEDNHLVRFEPNIAILSEDNSSKRSDGARVKTGGNSSMLREKKEEKERLKANPYMLDDWESMHGKNIRPFMRRRGLAAYAKRLIDITDASTRKSKRSFNEKNIIKIYTELNKLANIEIVDTILSYQCLTGGALDLRFLKPVVERLKDTNPKKPPVLYRKESETSGSYLTALAVWRIISARQKPSPNNLATEEHH